MIKIKGLEGKSNKIKAFSSKPFLWTMSLLIGMCIVVLMQMFPNATVQSNMLLIRYQLLVLILGTILTYRILTIGHRRARNKVNRMMIGISRDICYILDHVAVCTTGDITDYMKRMNERALSPEYELMRLIARNKTHNDESVRESFNNYPLLDILTRVNADTISDYPCLQPAYISLTHHLFPTVHPDCEECTRCMRCKTKRIATGAFLHMLTHLLCEADWDDGKYDDVANDEEAFDKITLVGMLYSILSEISPHFNNGDPMMPHRSLDDILDIGEFAPKIFMGSDVDIHKHGSLSAKITCINKKYASVVRFVTDDLTNSPTGE